MPATNRSAHWVTTSGDVKWKRKTEGGVFAGPAVAKGVVVIPSVDKKVYGLDAARLAERRRFDRVA